VPPQPPPPGWYHGTANRHNLRLVLIGGVILALLTGIAIAAAGGKSTTVTLPASPPPGRTAFFVSPKGDDANPGTLARPWRTIAKAMTQSYTAGDQLLFQRGGEYFGTIDNIPTPNGSHRWLIGAYDEGAKPIITNAKLLNNSAAWTLDSPNVWRINLTDPSTHGGWTESETNIGFLRTGNTIYGAKKKSLAELSAQWDFYDDSTYLYVRSTSNPTTLAPDLRAAPDSILIRVNSNTEINGIEMKDCGGHAIRSEFAAGSVMNVHVLNNYIHDIGGSFLLGYADDKVRYGNAIECLDSCADWLVQGNEVHDVYDTAFTCQGSDSTWNNIRVTENYFHDNSHTIEFWTQGHAGGLYNILIDNNDFEGGGYGWGGPLRPDQENRAHFISYGWALPANILLTNNRVKRAYSSYRYHSLESGYPKGWVFTNNDIQLVSGTLMQNREPYTINNAPAWAAANHTESGSTFEVLDGS
jgi:hypothetical protein